MGMSIEEAFGWAPHRQHHRHGEILQHLDGDGVAGPCPQGDDVTSGESWAWCSHGQELSEDSMRLLAELEDEGFGHG